MITNTVTLSLMVFAIFVFFYNLATNPENIPSLVFPIVFLLAYGWELLSRIKREISSGRRKNDDEGNQEKRDGAKAGRVN
jgi:uncharacterized membrane protein